MRGAVFEAVGFAFECAPGSDDRADFDIATRHELCWGGQQVECSVH